MTPLSKPIKRKVAIERHRGYAPDQFAVTLYPNGDIGFRRLRTKKEYRVPLARVYLWTAMAYAEAERAEKRKAKKK